MEELDEGLFSSLDREIRQLGLSTFPSEAELRSYAGRTSELLTLCVEERRKLTDAELVHVRALDRVLLPAGITSSNLIRLHHIGPSFVQRHVMRTIEAGGGLRVSTVRDVGAVFLAITSQIRASVFADRLPSSSRTTELDDRPFAKLLAGRADIEGDDREGLRHLGFVAAAPFVIACLTTVTPPIDDELAAQLIPALAGALDEQRTANGFRPVIQSVEGLVVAVVAGTKPPLDPIVDAVRSVIRDTAHPPGLLGAVWGPVPTVHAISGGFRRAIEVVENMRELGIRDDVVPAERALDYLLLRANPGLTAELASTVDSIASDTNAKALVSTILAFERCSCNVAATAEMLFVHRHTVYARMRRLEELTGYSLEDASGRRLLNLSIAAKELLDRAVI